MYPERLETEQKRAYFSDRDCFTADPHHLTHTYIHNNYNCRMHAHQFYEMNIIVGGEGRHYIEDFSLPACTGDVFVLPSEVSHGYYAAERLDIYHILLKSDFLVRYREELAQFPGFSLLFDIEPHLRRASGKSEHLQVERHALPHLLNMLERINSAETGQLFAYQNVLTLAFIGELSLLLYNTPAGTARREIVHVMAHIRENLGTKLTLDSLAAFANMSKPTLNRMFREALSTSPMQYVTRCRLARARELLAQGGKSKSEIAQLCGFFDISHLNKYL